MCISIPGSTGFPGMGHPRIVPEIPGYKVFQDPWAPSHETSQDTAGLVHVL